MRGVLVSADQVPQSNGSFVSFMLAGLIQSQLNWRLSNETIIEHIRNNDYSKSTSRLRGMYFFENRDLAQNAVNESWGGHFKLDNLVELELYPSGAVTRVDANWITHAPRTVDNRLDMSDLSWIKKYWDGHPYCDQPTWELIANGEAIILTTSARVRAYEVAKREFPLSWEFIEMSRIATEVGSQAGLTTPFIHGISANRFSLDYAFHVAPFGDAKVVARMTEHPDWCTASGLRASQYREGSDRTRFSPLGPRVCDRDSGSS